MKAPNSRGCNYPLIERLAGVHAEMGPIERARRIGFAFFCHHSKAREAVLEFCAGHELPATAVENVWADIEAMRSAA